MTEKRFTDIEHDFENARIKCKDDGLFMLYAIYEDDDGLPTLGDLLNGLSEENEQLKQFQVKLDNRIQKLKEDLEKLTEMDKSDLNPQAVEDVATVIGISLNALMEFRKELNIGDLE